MALGLKLTQGATSFKFKVSIVQISYDKNLINAMLPQNRPFVKDLGSRRPIITITGWVDDVSPGNDTDGIPIISQASFETTVVEGWGIGANTIACEITRPGAITKTYSNVKIVRAAWTGRATPENQWEYQLVLSVGRV